MKTRKSSRKGGFSLLEFLAVVTIVGIIVAIILPRMNIANDNATTKLRDHHKEAINKAVERYYVKKGIWPANDLSDISADVNYFPDGVPINPVDNTAFKLNATTHRVD